MPSNTEAGNRRAAGGLEQYSIYRKELRAMAPVVVGARYSQQLDRETLFPALKSLVYEEPLLCTTIQTQDSPRKAEFVKIQTEIDLEVIVSRRDGNIDDIVSDFFYNNDISYNQPSKPLWRIIIVGGTMLLWFFDHAPFDGSSGAIFHQKLLKHLNSSGRVSADAVNPIIPTSPEHIPPSYEQIADIRPPWHIMLGKIFHGLILEKIWPPTRNPISWAGYPSSYPFKTHTLFGHLDEKDSSKLLERARANSTTITGILTAVLIEVVAEHVPAELVGSNGKTIVEYSLPINTRGKYPMDSKHKTLGFGNFVSSCDSSISLNREFPPTVIELAKSLILDLKKDIDSMRGIYDIGTLQYVNVQKYLTGKKNASGPRRALAEVSNLGAFPAGEGNWKISELIFSQANSSEGASFILNVVGILSGRISYAISLPTEKDEVATFINAYTSKLQAFLSE